MSIPPSVENSTSGLRLVTSIMTAAYSSRSIGQRSSTRRRSTRLPPIVISSIALAAAAASSGPSAIFIPPDFPRLPASTCALITEGPMLATAALTSSGVLQTTPFGINTAAGSRTFLQNSSAMFLSSVPSPMRAKKLFFRWLIFGDGDHEMGDVEKVFVVQIF